MKQYKIALVSIMALCILGSNYVVGKAGADFIASRVSQSIPTVTPPTLQSIEEKPSEQLASVPEQQQEVVSVDLPEEPTPEPTPEPQVTFGEDPTHPGLYKVFDTQAIMTEAGIASEDQHLVDEMVRGDNLLGDWYYNQGGGQITGTVLFNVLPSIMESYNSGYATSPVIQLKWADSYVKSKYVTWEKAHMTWYALRKF